MYNAFAASGFLVLERTFVEAQKSVFFELPAFSTELAVGAMVVFAEDVYHVAYGFLFSFHSFVFWIGRLRQHSNSPLKRAGVHIRIYPKMLGIIEHDNSLEVKAGQVSQVAVSVLHHSTICFSDSSLFFKASMSISFPRYSELGINALTCSTP